VFVKTGDIPGPRGTDIRILLFMVAVFVLFEGMIDISSPLEMAEHIEQYFGL